MAHSTKTVAAGTSEETVPVVLPHPLDEFRSALNAEIDAASRESAAAAVSLHSGKRVGQVGGAYQYVFKVESALNLPTDSPGELHISGQQPADATIISVEGLNVTISVERDLGAGVPQARLRNDLAFLLRRLIERIEGYASKPNPGGERLLGQASATGQTGSVRIPALNEQQAAAVASALGRDTTFIWGPPGTGKTATIGHIGAELYVRDRSLLLVSHTNIAVDQALMRIADIIEAERPGELEAGKVLRVGEPRDGRLAERPQLLLAEHAKRRSAELAERLAALQQQRVDAARRVMELLGLADIAEWAVMAGTEISEQQQRLDRIEQLLARVAELEDEIAGRAESEPIWREQLAVAEAAQQAAADEQRLSAQLETLSSESKRLSTELERHGPHVQALRQKVASSETLQGAFQELRSLPSSDAMSVEMRRTGSELAAAREALAQARVKLAEEEETLGQVQASGVLARRWKGLPKPEEQQLVVDGSRADVEAAEARADAATAARQDAERRLERRKVLVEELTSREHLEDLPALRQKLEEAEAEESRLSRQLRGALSDITEAKKGLAAAQDSIARFSELFSEPAAEIADAVSGRLSALDELRSAQDRDRQEAQAEERRLDEWSADRMAVLRDSSVVSTQPADTPAGRLRQIADAHAEALEKLGGRTSQSLRADVGSLNEEIEGLDERIAEVEESLSKIEDELVAEAAIVATTLTRAYLRDYIQERRFDTVVLDEASMAPIPALWVAAGVADRGVVIVGDPNQLPPIKHSQLDVAEKWLGNEIFDVSGVVERSNNGGADHLIQLRTQYRMHPDISRLPNKLVYEGRLKDGPHASDDSGLDGWYDRDWGGDAPVLLVDTGPLDAWVTTVDRGTKTSRLNFLSATVACDLAEKVLLEGREPLVPGQPARVLIVTPYRPQANLLERLIEHQGLGDEVAVGTAHSFQGNEAPVVILDLVVDEPHWRVGLFIPALDDQNRKLLNVALTRAQNRLLVVADFDYASTKGKKAFLGRLVTELKAGAECVPAEDLLTVELSAKAAQAHLQAAGGPIEPGEDRLVVTQAAFFQYLAWDLANARQRVVIYSPFLTVNRLEWLDPHLRAAVDRGIRVYAITKPLDERNKGQRGSAKTVEERLRSLGVHVLHKRMMHEKVIIVDDHITWVGSLNALSFSNTAEVMERRDSRQVVGDYVKTLHVDEIVAGIDQDETTCPVCGVDMEAAEGDRGPYWRCPDKCYTRSLDKPPPKDGLLPCHNCGERVEFGEWGGRPHWRCVENSRHRMAVHKSHLRLPKMKALVPKKELRELERSWQ